MSRTKILMVWSLITVFGSSASFLTRFCGDVPASSIGFWRVFGAGMMLLPGAVYVARSETGERIFTVGSITAGIFLGVHFSSWSWAIQHTTIANATLFIALQVLIVPFTARLILGERPNFWEKAGMALAFTGTLWLGIHQATISRGDIPGSAVALCSAVICSVYVTTNRKYRPSQNALVFTAGVFLVAAAVQAAGAFLIDGTIELGNTKSILSLAGLVLFPTLGGHGLGIFLMRYARPQLHSFSIPMLFVISTIAAVPVFGEVPPLWFYPGAGLILTGVLFGICNFQE